MSHIFAAALFCLTLSAQAQEPIQIIEMPTDLDMAQVELGKKLYFDPRLSKSGWISCNSCHNLSMGGTDNLPSSIGHNWQQGPINSPTVLNSSFNLAQFWDGRAADLAEQAAGPIANPGEMAFTHELAIEVLQSIPGYVAEFQSTFGDNDITIDRVTTAIAEFEKTLVTPNSRFDQWLSGNENVLTEEEQDGYRLFKLTGCIGCHNGPAVGGNAYQRMGSFNRYETDNPATGRQAVTGIQSDRLRFKVPTLRNIELTYPYFHDGQVKTLTEAVDTMAWVQLNRRFSPEGTAKVVAFLKSLTGEQPSFALPILPPSGPETPSPEPFSE
ncbi:cytochrome-c peroxidase [Gammaproteobacteria bacterium]|nr:cytochrome-c peroxidase [Gammaproteobacteria bacterium]